MTAAGSATEGGSASADKTITMGIIPSWTDGLSLAYLWKDVLESNGYQVDIKEISDAAPLYAGLAKGDVDIYPSAWPELTHASYMDKYGDDIEDLGTYYDGAKLTFAVPDYSELTSIADLTGMGDEFDGKIIGIEPGAGLTETKQKILIPAYGLEGEYQLVTSSTAAMLTELKTATDKQEDLVVTLWRPFWANDAFAMKDTRRPHGRHGAGRGAALPRSTKGFRGRVPQAAELIEKIKLDDAQDGSASRTGRQRVRRGQGSGCG